MDPQLLQINSSSLFLYHTIPGFHDKENFENIVRKEEMQVTNVFSFSNIVFYAFIGSFHNLS